MIYTHIGTKRVQTGNLRVKSFQSVACHFGLAHIEQVLLNMDDAFIQHLYSPSKVTILCVMLHWSILHKSAGATTEEFSAVEVGM